MVVRYCTHTEHHITGIVMLFATQLVNISNIFPQMHVVMLLIYILGLKQRFTGALSRKRHEHTEKKRYLISMHPAHKTCI
jgi:uncharacterized membrane protein